MPTYFSDCQNLKHYFNCFKYTTLDANCWHQAAIEFCHRNFAKGDAENKIRPTYFYLHLSSLSLGYRFALRKTLFICLRDSQKFPEVDFQPE